MKSCVGIDLGGTFLKFTSVDSELRSGELLSLPTPGSDGPDAIVDAMVQGCLQVMDQASLKSDDVCGIGVGSPGPLDRDAGIILSLPNLPGMENFPLRDRLVERLSLPVVIENDANAAAFGEFICGAGKSVGNMVMLTLGTGLGSGIIIDGKILHGSHFAGGEMGHVIVEVDGRPCPCGQKGCIEQYVSATNIARYAEQEAKEAEEGILWNIIQREGSLTSKDVQAAWADGDVTGQRVWEESMRYLAIGCVNICRLFDPDSIILAGGMVAAGDDLMEPLMRHVKEQHWTILDLETRLAIASLGNDAGAIGAAGVALDFFGRGTG